ncbi:MFS transporter [Saccharothrix sp. AJ9571]|nr:MFS transporter [Saccharothrix sp. AJ9571]
MAEGTLAPAPVRHPANFGVLWTADLGARFGYQISVFLLPLIVVTVLDGSGTSVGLVSASQFVPILVLSLAVGAWTHRLSLRRLLAVSNLVRGLAFLCLGALHAAGGLVYWELLVIAVVIGAVTVFYDIGLQVAVPRFFSGSRLVSVNGFLQATTSVSQMAGPAVAGFLAQRAGISAAGFITGGVLCAAAVLFTCLRAESRDTGPAQRIGTTIRTGLRFTWRCRPIRDLCTQSALFNLHEQAFLTVFLIFGVRTLGLSGGLVGTLIGLGSIGAIAGSLLAGRIGRRLHLGITLTVSIFVAAMGLLLVPVFAATAGGTTWLLGAGFVVNGLALAGYNVLAITLRQEIPPPELLGSVTASYRIAAFGTMPLGALAGGLLVDGVGAGTALWMVSCSLTAASLLLFFSPLRRARDLEHARALTAPSRTEDT